VPFNLTRESGRLAHGAVVELTDDEWDLVKHLFEPPVHRGVKGTTADSIRRLRAHPGPGVRQVVLHRRVRQAELITGGLSAFVFGLLRTLDRRDGRVAGSLPLDPPGGTV
jgi:hypothetical protein